MELVRIDEVKVNLSAEGKWLPARGRDTRGREVNTQGREANTRGLPLNARLVKTKKSVGKRPH